MATLEYIPEDGAYQGVPRLAFPPTEPQRNSHILWGKLKRERRWDDDFLSEYLGVTAEGVPFYDADGDVETHRVRIINGSPLLLEP